MKRLLVVVMILLAAPTLAQSATVDPAAYLPGSTAIYLDLQSAGLSALDPAVSVGAAFDLLPPGAAVDTLLTPTLERYLPGIDAHSDVLTWTSDHIGIAQSSSSADPLLVLPIADASGAQAFVAKATAGAKNETVGGVNVYTTGSAGLVVGSDVIWLGSPTGIANFVQTPLLERLSDSPDYQKVRAALPADAALTVYADGDALATTLASTETKLGINLPPEALMQAAFRLNPAQSAAEDALLQSPGVNGFGAAFQVSGGSLAATVALSVDAQYPAPTLANATAGTALFNLPPGDSFFVFDSYDLSLLSIPLGLLTYLQPTVQAILSGGRPTAGAPTSADELVAEAQPILAEAQSLAGLSLDQAYRLIDGEYAVAAFPGPGPTVGAALYLQSSDPQQIIDTLDHVSALILTDPASGARLVTPMQATIDGLSLTLLSAPSLAEPLALGVIDQNVLFLTTQSVAPKVIDAARQPQTASPLASVVEQFGAGQAALFYAEPRTIDLYNIGHQRNPPLPTDLISGAVTAGENGLFTLRVAARMTSP